MTASLGALHPYRICRATDLASRIARELESSHAPFLVVHGEGSGGWRVFEVTPGLLAQLAASPHASVAEALRSHKVTGPQWLAKRLLQFGATRGPMLARLGPQIVLDDAQHPVGVVTDLPASEAELFPVLTPSARSVAPDDIVEFELALERTAPLGPASTLPLQFGPGETSVTLRASVSSSHFRPENDAWERELVVERNPARRPLRWTFKARVVGDRPAYTLSVRFFRRGEIVGSTVVTLAQSRMMATLGPSDDPEVPPAASGRLRPLSVLPAMVPVTLDIAELGGEARRISMYRNGAPAGTVVWVATELASYTSELEQAKSLEAVRQLGFGLLADLPVEVRRFLEDPAQAGDLTLIAAASPVAPFEVLQLRAADSGPFLGVERPIARWISPQPADLTEVRIDEVVCIRPVYAPPYELASAEHEEGYLREHHAPVTPIRTTEELQHALATSSARLVHFAGHADGNPAQLSLQNGPVRPQIFHPSTALMRAHPFMFLNGCRAGAGRPTTPAAQANMVRYLISAGAAGIMAPMIQTQSPAALRAASMFYDRIAAGKTVCEAAREVREQAMAAEGGDAATFLSYLAFAAPTLQLQIERRT